MLGNDTFDRTLNLLLLLGKQFIYRMKFEGRAPCIIAFRKIITNYYKVEKFSFINRVGLVYFKRMWFKYKGILDNTHSMIKDSPDFPSFYPGQIYG